MEYTLARAMIENNCKEILEKYRNSPSRIYRGTYKAENIYFTNPKTSKRQSQNTLNFYTVLFDNLPSWKNYPKRGNGVICSSYGLYVSGYSTSGGPFVAFPYDNTNIGVCPRSDIWECFLTIVSDLSGFIGDLSILFTPIRIDLTTKASLTKALSSMESKLKTDSDIMRLFNKLFMKPYDGKEPLLKFFNDIFDPDKAGFSHYTTSNYPAPDKKEVWFDGSAVMVRDLTLLEQLGVSINYDGEAGQIV
jgi:hypothetical protein